MSQGFIQVVVLALIKKENKYLFTLRNDGDSEFNGKWQIPGGGLEFGEKVLDCLHREVKEELGTEVSVISSIPIIDSEIRGTWQGVFITYVCELNNNSSPIVLNDEATDFKWVSYEELKSIEYLPGCKEMVEEAEELVSSMIK